MNKKVDTLLNGCIKIQQPKKGFKISSDAVFLASAFCFNKMIEKNKEVKVLDAGAGTGAISLCLVHKFSNLKITGVEFQKDLYQQAEKNKKLNHMDSKINLINDDLKNLSAYFPKNHFDYIITNPPFYSGLKPKHDDKAKAHTETITVKEWVNLTAPFLNQRGGFIIIHKFENLDSIITAFHKNNIGKIEIIPLWSKESDIHPKRLIIKGQKNLKPGTILYKGLTLHNKLGNYTKEAEEILRKNKSIYNFIK